MKTLGLFLTVLFLMSNPSKADTVVEQCLAPTGVLKGILTCAVKTDYDDSIEVFSLVRGEVLKTIVTGQFGQYRGNLAVRRIQHLPPRITDIGAMDESLRFIATSGSTTAMLTIPCHQADYAAIGMTVLPGDKNPAEQIAQCSIK